MQRATRDVVTAWILAIVCCSHHLGHMFHAVGLHSLAHSEVMGVLANPWVAGTLGAAALLGPGRALVTEGFQSLARGNPNMNSLVGLGCTASFG